MAVSVNTMNVVQLAEFLQANASYTSAIEGTSALALDYVEGVGMGGTAFEIIEGGAAATSSATTTGATIIDFATGQALEAAGTEVSTAAIGLSEGATAGTYSASALLGVKLPIVAAAAAPILGVGLGAGLYALNPELWTKISQKLLPFCYPGTDTIPTWADIAASTWTCKIAKGIIDALKELFQDEGILDSEGNFASEGKTSDLNTNLQQPIRTYTSYQMRYAGRIGTVSANYPSIPYSVPGGRGFFCFVSDSPGTVTLSAFGSTYNWNFGSPVTINGKPVYIIRISTSFDFMDKVAYNKLPDDNSAWTAVYGQPVGTQEGVSEWKGTTPTEIPEAKPAVIGVDPATGTPTTQPMVPISFPHEIPEITPSEPSVPSADPEEQPDPTVTDDPDKQVQPYIQPLPIPWEITQPEDAPQPDPDADPSQLTPPDSTITQTLDLIPVPVGIVPWPAMPDTPPPFAQNVGMVTVYHPTTEQLYAFERWLWVTLSQADINTVWNNPFDGVIGLFELYCTPTDIGNRNIHSGFLDSGINSAVISRYTEINCGTLGIPEYYGNYFDYSPYSKAHIYLPFVGIQELNVDDIVGHAVNVTYRIDEYNGSCIAMITVAKVTEVNGERKEYSNVMYQFSGNCAVDLPIAGGSQASIKAGMTTANAYQQAGQIAALGQFTGGLMSMLGGILGVPGFSMGGAVSGLTGSLSTAYNSRANALSNMLSGKSTVQKSGQFGSSHGALGLKKPFIVVTRPKQIQVPNYEQLYGFPAHKMVTVGSCTGFLRCREVHVVSARANDEEKAAIEAALKSGVYVTE